jgi:hypothetical protein
VSWSRDSAEDWVLKPALGRVGDGIGITGATEEKDWKTIRRDMRRRPGSWAAQRRFTALPLRTAEGDLFPCIGVYTVGLVMTLVSAAILRRKPRREAPASAVPA